MKLIHYAALLALALCLAHAQSPKPGNDTATGTAAGIVIFHSSPYTYTGPVYRLSVDGVLTADDKEIALSPEAKAAFVVLGKLLTESSYSATLKISLTWQAYRYDPESAK